MDGWKGAGVRRGWREKERGRGGKRSEGENPRVNDEADGEYEPEKTGGKIY